MNAACVRRPNLVAGKDLDRNVAIQVDVAGLVDHAHAALSELLENPVVRKGAIQHGLGLRRKRDDIILPGS